MTEITKTILITGGSGLLGTALTALLLKHKYEVRHLSRTEDLSGEVKAYAWDYPSGKLDARALEGVYAIIHLAGAGIAERRWTDERKKLIIDSRVKTAELILSTCERTGHWPEIFISASGINYYGTSTSTHIYKEDDAPSPDFIGQCCVLWEAAALAFKPHCRVAMLRTGVVLATEGGALPRIAAPVRYGFGAPLGSGKQWMPYIHIDDLCSMYLFAIENEAIRGAYNACNGDHVNNKEVTQTIAKALKKPLWLPAVPSFLLRTVLGEMSQLLLSGSRASSERIAETGFQFRFKDLHGSMDDLYNG